MARHETAPTHAKFWLNTLLNQYSSDHKGLLYEERFCEACRELQTQGLIDGYEHYTKNSDEDLKGIDVAIKKDGESIFFQITSSLDNAHRHQKTHSNHPDRPPVHIIYVRQGNQPLMKSTDNLQKEIARKIKTPY